MDVLNKGDIVLYNRNLSPGADNPLTIGIIISKDIISKDKSASGKSYYRIYWYAYDAVTICRKEEIKFLTKYNNLCSLIYES